MSLKDKKTFRNLNQPSKEKFSSQNVVYLEKETTRAENLSKPLVKANSIKFEFNFINYTVKIINDPDPILLKAKALRYKSFFGKKQLNIYDSDQFDQYCDHLVVIDNSISKDHVVGTYRLLFKPKSTEYRLFYSASEFDLKNLFNKPNQSMLEAGRSCVHEDYRDGRIIKLLWRGLATYILLNKIDLIFGCASFPSSNCNKFIDQLSYLHHYHRPPNIYLTEPLNKIKADYKILKSNKLDKEAIFRSLPPLIKAYIRTGAWIGPGAIIDEQFDTTDVLIILRASNIMKKYSNLSLKK